MLAPWRGPERAAHPFYAVLALGFALTACHSAGPYGFSRDYSPLSDEKAAARGAKEYDPVMIERDPATWKGQTLSIFGVVKQRGQAAGGMAYLSLSVRTLATRNLCDAMDEDSCRVTVSDHEFAVIHASVKLQSADDIGKDSLAPGSLVRVIGKLTDDVDRTDGLPVLQASYYRHWPRNYFVTMADRDNMRL
jgi:hypothetical protein